jgi:hypothetical protein
VTIDPEVQHSKGNRMHCCEDSQRPECRSQSQSSLREGHVAKDLTILRMWNFGEIESSCRKEQNPWTLESIQAINQEGGTWRMEKHFGI